MVDVPHMLSLNLEGKISEPVTLLIMYIFYSLRTENKKP